LGAEDQTDVQLVKPTSPSEEPSVNGLTDQVEDEGGSLLPEFVNYLFILRQHLLLFLAVFAVVAGIVTFLGMRQQKVYRAKATVLVAYSAPNVLHEGDDIYQMSHRLWEYQRYFETQPEVITSREVLQEVADTLDLANDEDFLGISEIENAAERREAKVNADPVRALRKRIDVEPLRDSLALSIYVRDTDRNRAADIANAVAVAYSGYYENQRNAVTEVAADWLKERVADLEDEVRAAEDAVLQFRRENDFIEGPQDVTRDMGSERIVTLSEAVTRNEIELADLETRWLKAQALDADNNAAAIPDVLNDRTIQTLKQQVFETAAAEAELRARYGEKMPRLKRIQAEREDLERTIEVETVRILDSLRTELEAARETQARLRRQLEAERELVQELKEREVAFERLDRGLRQTEELYRQISNRSLETELAGMLEYSNISVLDKALAPERPFEPRLRVIVLLALALATGLAILAVFIVDRLDSSVRGGEQLEAEFHLPVIGIQPKYAPSAEAQESASPLHISEEPRGPLAESCRTIRTNLMFMSPGQDLHTMLVTSAGPSEGKTILSSNLAYTMASAGKRTILIDTDMRRPRVHKVFQLTQRGSLAAALIGEVPFEQAVIPSGYPNLDLIPLGPVPPNPAELLDSASFHKLLEWLKSRYDRVIFDSPPTMAVTDASILAQYVDGVLLVAREDKTNRHVLRQALRSLQTVNARVLGFVLNDVDLEKARRGYYSYRYRYRYPYYYYTYRYFSRYAEDGEESVDGTRG